MEQTQTRNPVRCPAVSAARTAAALLAIAATAAAFGLITGSPEPGPARAAQSAPATPPAAEAKVAELAPSPAAEEDGNVFMYH
jgi:hypothetical protein